MLANNLLASVLRTVVPLIVASVVNFALKYNVEIDGNLLEYTLTTVITTAYYVVFRFMETRVAPAWGWLLGYAKAPAYSPAAPPAGPIDGSGDNA